MRINRYIAQATGLSRRSVDSLIQTGRVSLNGQAAQLGSQVQPGDTVALDGKPVTAAAQATTIMLHKPVGYVCSRDGQGSRTVYELLPPGLHQLKPVGRLDKDSSGLLLLTTDGQLAHQLTHPGFQKKKVYTVILNKSLAPTDKTLLEQGIQLDDGPSFLKLKGQSNEWQVTLYEGRNRQIRRTFTTVGYNVTKLHRTTLGPYRLGNLQSGQFQAVHVD